MYTMGIDIGSASSKVVIMKDGKDVVAAEVVQFGTGSTGPQKALEKAYEVSGLKKEDISYTVATGYGRLHLRKRISRSVRSAVTQKEFTIWYQLHVPSLTSAVRTPRRSGWMTRVESSSFL